MDYFIGHLIGDFLLQNDWQAMNKKSPSLKGWIACFIHCLVYTWAVILCTGWWEWYLIVLVFISHFPIDKTYGLVWWMMAFGSFKRILANNSIDIHHKTWAYLFVDQTAHLSLLWLISKFAA